VDLGLEDLAEAFGDWQSDYDEFRGQCSLRSRTPWQVWYERARLTPLFEGVKPFTTNRSRSRSRIELELPSSRSPEEPSPKEPSLDGQLYPHAPEIVCLRQDLGRQKSIRSPPHPGPKSALELHLRRTRSSSLDRLRYGYTRLSWCNHIYLPHIISLPK
jgi:hypothetical protein